MRQNAGAADKSRPIGKYSPLRALAEVTLSKGRDPPPNYALPAEIKVVDAEAWRNELISANVLDHKTGNPWARFRELRASMAVRNLIGSRDDLVWSLRPT
jgi:hypothetical protein